MLVYIYMKLRGIPLKHCIHFLLSILCPPTSNMLQKYTHALVINPTITEQHVHVRTESMYNDNIRRAVNLLKVYFVDYEFRLKDT